MIYKLFWCRKLMKVRRRIQNVKKKWIITDTLVGISCNVVLRIWLWKFAIYTFSPAFLIFSALKRCRFLCSYPLKLSALPSVSALTRHVSIQKGFVNYTIWAYLLLFLYWHALSAHYILETLCHLWHFANSFCASAN